MLQIHPNGLRLSRGILFWQMKGNLKATRKIFNHKGLSLFSQIMMEEAKLKVHLQVDFFC